MENVSIKGKNGWISKFIGKTSYQLPILTEKPKISYSTLKQLCSIEGLGNRRKDSTKNAHNAFMNNYLKILKSDDKLPALDVKPYTNGNGKLDYIGNHRPEKSLIPHDHHEPHYCSSYSYDISHNISDHLALLHKQHITQTKDGILKTKAQALIRLLEKLPFERSRTDQESIYHHLQYFTKLTSQIPLKILRELCSVIQLEKWNHSDYTVIGYSELFLILKGSVTRCDDAENGYEEIQSEKLVAGDCFGTLHPKSEGIFTQSMMRYSGLQKLWYNCTNGCSVITLEPCEFVKISAKNFRKMKQVVDSKITNQNLDLMQSCSLFENCSKVALGKIVDLIRWKHFYPGTVLVNEGESCRVIGFISEGTCNLKRRVDVAKTNRDGTKERRQKQVIVGNLGPGDSFGECSVLRKQPIAYSVVTSSHAKLGVISQHDFNDVDEVTKSLLTQCYEAMGSNFGEEDLQKQYVEQQKQKEWRKFKRIVIHDIIFHRSILPGYSKWSRNPTHDDVANLA